MRARSGFTLFEIAISLAIAGATVVTALALFPAGVRAQQLARFRLYAAAKAMEISERFVCANVGNPAIDNEATAPWDVAVGYRAQSSDLECKVSGHRFGMHPLPRAIARRLDSEADEIQRILDDGGDVYYFAPTGGGSWREDTLPLAPPDDGQRVIVGIEGDAQANAIPVFPLKAWPYQVPYPSPPTHVIHGTGAIGFWPSAPANVFSWAGGAGNTYLYDDVSDPSDPDLADIRKVFFWHESSDANDYGYKPFLENANATTVIRYLQGAIWWVAKLDQSHGGIANLLLPTGSPLPPPLTDFSGSTAEPRTQVLALRYLAHAGLSLTSYFRYAGDLDNGHDVPPVTLDGVATPDVKVTNDLIRWWDASALNLVNRYAASFPYDWGAPRPLERAIMMDEPLLEYDLFSPPISGQITGTGIGAIPAKTAAQWRVISPQPIRHLGRSMSYPGFDIAAATWSLAGGSGSAGILAEQSGGGVSHFTLAAPFDASERCRQLVFWAVDWQSYVDCETAPSAPLDASKYPKWAPVQEGATLWDFDRMMSAAGSGPGWCPGAWVDHHLHTYRNPEKELLFTRDVSGLATGADVTSYVVGNTDWSNFPLDEGASTADPGPVRIFNGLYGADRNFNHQLDRGPVPASARLRAITLGRWNFYDPRVPLQLR